MVKVSFLACATVVSILTGRGSTPTSVHDVTDEYMPPTYVVAVTGMPSAERRSELTGAIRATPEIVRGFGFARRVLRPG